MEAEKRNYRQVNMDYWSDGSAARVLQPKYEEKEYVDGNTVRTAVPAYEPEPVQRPQRVPKQRPEQTPVQEPKTRSLPKPRVEQNIDFISMCILLVAIAATLYTCVTFLQVQADTVVVTKNIRALEKELANLQNRNEAAYNEVLSAVSLDQVYQTAVGELGMVFPNNNVTYYYESNSDGYVRQYESIPEAEKLSILKELFP